MTLVVHVVVVFTGQHELNITEREKETKLEATTLVFLYFTSHYIWIIIIISF